jgi:ABC-type Fe3+-siderophore transport system permease subunit
MICCKGMMGKLSGEQRSIVAEKFMEWGNLVFVGLVIGQLVPGTASFRWWLFIAGLLGMGLAYLVGVLLLKLKGGD